MTKDDKIESALATLFVSWLNCHQDAHQYPSQARCLYLVDIHRSKQRRQVPPLWLGVLAPLCHFGLLETVCRQQIAYQLPGIGVKSRLLLTSPVITYRAACCPAETNIPACSKCWQNVFILQWLDIQRMRALPLDGCLLVWAYSLVSARTSLQHRLCCSSKEG